MKKWKEGDSRMRGHGRRTSIINSDYARTDIGARTNQSEQTFEGKKSKLKVLFSSLIRVQFFFFNFCISFPVKMASI